MHVQEGRVLLPAAAAALVLLADLVGFVEGPIESAPAAVEPAPPVIPAPPPLTRAEIFAQLPVNGWVPVFIPTAAVIRAGMAVPTTTAGYNPNLTFTFDDCGDPATVGAIVDVLQQSQRQALFFITGQCRDRYPWLIPQLQAAGQLTCNHTYSHPDLRRLSNAAIRAEIAAGVLAGCPYFRPPYGGWDGPRGRIALIAAQFGLRVLLWDVDTRDWAGAGAATMVAAVRARGGVVLFHLHGLHTLEAVQALA
ncbi:MAG: polysaccharide deacetylase family protein [Chloroflexi bacterium]|nr:MAG: polysaccharide deacetylase family protein [Chloroflexota bacterium]